MMKSIASQLFVYMIVLIVSVQSHHIYENDDKMMRMTKIEHDNEESGCCPLVWMPLVRGNSQFKVIPFSSVPAAMNNQSNIYYVRKGSKSMYPGIMDDSFNTYFEDGKNQRVNWSEIEVLTNPYECKINWFNVTNDQIHQLKTVHMPTFNDFPFTTDWTNGTNMNHTVYDIYEVYYGMAIGDTISQPKDKSIYLLYNNCSSQTVDDLRNWIQLTVVNFTYDNVNLSKPFFPSTLESLSMVNEKDTSKSAQVGLEAIVPDMTYIYHPQLPLSVIESAFNTHYTEETEQQLFNLYDFLYQKYRLVFNVNSVANVTHDKTVSINEVITVEPRSNTTVQLLGKPIRGTIDATFTFKMSGVTLGEEKLSPWSNRRIVNALNRLDFPLIQQLSVIDDQLTLTYDVTIFIDTVQDARMAVNSIPLR